MKKICRKGVTLPVLIATIVIAIIIISTVVVSYNNIKISTLKKEFATEIYSIQKLVDEYNFRNNSYPIKEESINTEALTSFLTDNSSLSSDEFEIIDLYEAGVSETTRGIGDNESDRYIISTNTGKVYYLKGESIGDNVYYDLTEELKSQIGLNK